MSNLRFRGDASIRRSQASIAEHDSQTAGRKEAGFDPSIFYKFLVVPSNDRLCPPSKRSCCNQLQRLDFNSYNPIQAFEDLYESYTTCMGSMLTIAAILVFLSYSYFTLLDTREDFAQYQIKNLPLIDRREISVVTEGVNFGYNFVDNSGQNLNISGVDPGPELEANYYTCTISTVTFSAAKENRTVTFCEFLNTTGCSLPSGAANFTDQAACPDDDPGTNVTGVNQTASLNPFSISKGGGGDSSFLLLIVRATNVNNPNLNGGTSVFTVTNPGNEDIQRELGISYGGTTREKIVHEDAFTDILVLEAQFISIVVNREYQQGNREFNTYSITRQGLYNKNKRLYDTFLRSRLIILPNAAPLTSNVIFSAIVDITDKQIEINFQKRTYFDALAKIGGGIVVLAAVLHLYKMYFTKNLFRQARAFKPRRAAFVRLLRKKQKRLQMLQKQLRDMREPVLELGDALKIEKGTKDASKDLDAYFRTKEVSEMKIYYDALSKSLLINLDDFPNPIGDIDIDSYYAASGQKSLNTELKQKSPEKPRNVQLNTVLNRLALRNISRQLVTLKKFVEKADRKISRDLQKLDNSRPRTNNAFEASSLERSNIFQHSPSHRESPSASTDLRHVKGFEPLLSP